MKNRTKLLIVGAAVLALGATGGGLAIAGGSGDDTGDSEAPISGDALGRASDIAREHVGDGQVTDTEVGDEESYYEVEVSRPDGSEVDVQLDRDFNVVGDEADSESEDESGDD